LGSTLGDLKFLVNLKLGSDGSHNQNKHLFSILGKREL